MHVCLANFPHLARSELHLELGANAEEHEQESNCRWIMTRKCLYFINLYAVFRRHFFIPHTYSERAYKSRTNRLHLHTPHTSVDTSNRAFVCESPSASNAASRSAWNGTVRDGEHKSEVEAFGKSVRIGYRRAQSLWVLHAKHLRERFSPGLTVVLFSWDNLMIAGVCALCVKFVLAERAKKKRVEILSKNIELSSNNFIGVKKVNHSDRFKYSTSDPVCVDWRNTNER